MGYSMSYTFFAGALELLGALLLFFRRTTTLGALVSGATMLNVVMLNFSYDVTVKLGSMHLLLMAIFLAAPDLGRLANVLVLNRPTAPVAPGPTFSSRWMRVCAPGAKILLITFAVYSSTRLSLTLHRMNEQAREIPIYGIYEVKEFSRNGQLLPALTTDPVRWRKVLFGSRGTLSPMSIVMMDDSLQTYYSAKYDSDKHTVTIFTENGRKKNVLTYSRPDVDHLIVEGPFKEDSVLVKLEKLDETKLPLVSSRFHWLNDQI
jgi:hypothetical protein